MAIHDALKILKIPKIEVHISNIYNKNLYYVLEDCSQCTNLPSYLTFIFNVLSLSNIKISFFSLLTSLEILFDIQLSTNMKDAICVAVKFLLCIALLIFARGGIPRFRFDYLTKLG